MFTQLSLYSRNINLYYVYKNKKAVPHQQARYCNEISYIPYRLFLTLVALIPQNSDTSVSKEQDENERILLFIKPEFSTNKVTVYKKLSTKIMKLQFSTYNNEL